MMQKDHNNTWYHRYVLRKSPCAEVFYFFTAKCFEMELSCRVVCAVWFRSSAEGLRWGVWGDGLDLPSRQFENLGLESQKENVA